MRVEKRTLGIYWIQPPLTKSEIKIQQLRKRERERGFKASGKKSIYMRERSYKKKNMEETTRGTHWIQPPLNK